MSQSPSSDTEQLSAYEIEKSEDVAGADTSVFRESAVAQGHAGEVKDRDLQKGNIKEGKIIAEAYQYDESGQEECDSPKGEGEEMNCEKYEGVEKTSTSKKTLPMGIVKQVKKIKRPSHQMSLVSTGVTAKLPTWEEGAIQTTHQHQGHDGTETVSMGTDRIHTIGKKPGNLKLPRANDPVVTSKKKKDTLSNYTSVTSKRLPTQSSRPLIDPSSGGNTSVGGAFTTASSGKNLALGRKQQQAQPQQTHPKKKVKKPLSLSQSNGPVEDDNMAMSAKSASVQNQQQAQQQQNILQHPNTQVPPLQYSAAQAAVYDMMRHALEEDQYSAIGSIVETDESGDDEQNGNGTIMKRKKMRPDGTYDDEDDHLSRMWCIDSSSSATPSLMKIDRNLLLGAMKKRLRMEANVRMGNAASYFTMSSFVNRIKEKGPSSTNALYDTSYSLVHGRDEDAKDEGNEEDEDEDVEERGKILEDNYENELIDGADREGKPSEHAFQQRRAFPDPGSSQKEDIRRKRKRKRGKIINGGAMKDSTDDYFSKGDYNGYSDQENEIEETISKNTTDINPKRVSTGHSTYEDYYEDEANERFDAEESSIFGQTLGSTNATWVECDKCGKWRRLRGIVDAKKLPPKWYCSMNKRDPERARCSAPEEEYDAPSNTPESAADHRARKHLRLWVRRLHCNENYETRMLTTMTRGKKKSTVANSKDPYEWVRCCNPSCGKWRALLKFMDSSSVIEAAKNGEWYCVLNTWDEKLASCAAPQENLPAIGAPMWVVQDGKK